MSAHLDTSVWVVIPGLNEEKYIATVLKKVRGYTKNIVVVDDGSSDDMAQIAAQFTPHVLSHPVNLGKGAALKTGCEYVFSSLGATGVIFMDSDDQHDPKQLEQFSQALKQAPVVFGIRSFDEHMPLFRIMLNRMASFLILALFGSYIPDIPSGYKALSKKAYQKLKWKAVDYAVEMEIAARVAKSKMKYVTVPISTVYHDLDRGMTFLDSLKMITQILTWRISL